MRRKNLKKPAKRIMFFLMKKEKLIMINLDMLPFKDQVDKEVSVILIFHLLSLIFLKMYLVILDSEILVDQEVGQVKEEMI